MQVSRELMMYVPSENSSAVSTSSGRLTSESGRAGVFPSARLGARAAVRIASDVILRKKAASAVRDAHGAVHEALKLEPIGDVFAYLAGYRRA